MLSILLSIIIPTHVYLSKSAPDQVLCWTTFSISQNDTFSIFRCEYHHHYNTYHNGHDSILFFLIRAKYFVIHHHSNSSISVKINTRSSSMLDHISYFPKLVHFRSFDVNIIISTILVVMDMIRSFSSFSS